MNGFFITGTDTDAGKTIAAAWLTLHLQGCYWKPIQSGLEHPTDLQTVKTLTELPPEHFAPSLYEFTQPLSPHEAARRDNTAIAMEKFVRPQTDKPLIVEGAGGLLVPLTKEHLVIDLIKQLDLPAILVCRSGLGTINHTLLSLEALRHRNIPVAGLIINGPQTPHNRQALEEYGKIPVIAEIDQMPELTKTDLLAIKPEQPLRTLLQQAA